jgi:glycyl-tRNA synthetase beta chain
MAKTAELLIELFTEEIPARMQPGARAEGIRLLTAAFAEKGLKHGEIQSYTTPRRLTFVVMGLIVEQEDQEVEKKGPRVGSPEQATQGFLKSAGLQSIEEAEVRATDKGEFYFAVQHIKGQPTVGLLPDVIANLIKSFSWPKSMRWADNELTWVRPLRNILCIFDGQKVTGEFSFGKTVLPFTDTTVGHRFMAPESIHVTNFEQYQAKLLNAKVMVDHRVRQERIITDLQAAAKEKGGQISEDSGLLEEVTGLVEWPVILLGNINKDFMSLPKEVLMTAMRVHQRYFALIDAGGKLAPYFAFAANIEAGDKGVTIISGNQRVLAARLSDAKFFYEQDLKIPLMEHGKKLKNAVFHAQLGSMEDKVVRLIKLAHHIANLTESDAAAAEEAAKLCKADLATHMVYEFPELQGIMGAYYAKHYNVKDDIATAIREHYRPRGPHDEIPGNDIGKIVSLADKIDTIVGFFGIDIRPTGSKDPFALRRAALGIVRVGETMPHLALKDLLMFAYQLYPSGKLAKKLGPCLEDLEAFFLERIKVYWRDLGLRYDYIDAVFATGQDAPLIIMRQRVEALNNFMQQSGVGENLLAAYRRASNIVSIEEEKDKTIYGISVDKATLQEDAEIKLYNALNESYEVINNYINQSHFEEAMAVIVRLRPHIDRFFEHVTVNTEQENLRINRLKLLSMIRATLQQVADFSRIEG